MLATYYLINYCFELLYINGSILHQIFTFKKNIIKIISVEFQI